MVEREGCLCVYHWGVGGVSFSSSSSSSSRGSSRCCCVINVHSFIPCKTKRSQLVEWSPEAQLIWDRSQSMFCRT